MDENGEYVRANWEWAHYLPNFRCVVISDGNQATDPSTRFDGPEAWAAAAEFTRERLEQIRQLEEDCAMGRRLLSEAAEFDENSRDSCIFSRILARLESALADLKRGMRD